LYEDKNYKSILADMKKYIGDEIVKSEGSLVHNALSALAYEIEKLYIQMDFIIEQSHAGTADIEHLEMIALDRAIVRKEATNAYVKAEFNTAIPIGSRFSLKGYNYKAVEIINDGLHHYKMMIEETGAGANTLKGDLIPIDFIDGLESAKVTELLVAGDEEEDRDSLYKRYIQSFTSQSFAGNISAYKEKINSFSGIGGCKVYPVWNGPGTVKVVVISSDNTVVTEHLLKQLRESANPPNGYGWTPIGHDLTIESVVAVSLYVETSITFANGYNLKNSETRIIEKITEYLKDIAKVWKNGDEHATQTVYISRLEAHMLEVEGVEDVSNTKINKTPSNLILESNQIPVIGGVVIK
jgi:baseplate J-like protein